MTLDEWLASGRPADGFGVSRSLAVVTGERVDWTDADDRDWFVYVLADGTAVTFHWSVQEAYA